jgi:hypothetical protein
MPIGPKSTEIRGWDGPKIIRDIPETPRSRPRKDTKRWCRGIVGREHRKRWVSTLELSGFLRTPQQKAQFAEENRRWHWQQEVCEICGRQFRLRNPPGDPTPA